MGPDLGNIYIFFYYLWLWIGLFFFNFFLIEGEQKQKFIKLWMQIYITVVNWATLIVVIIVDNSRDKLKKKKQTWPNSL